MQDDARRLIQRATGAKRRHLARGNPSGVVARIRAAFGGLRVTLVCGLRLARSIPAHRRKVCCADLAPAKKKRHAEACLFFLAGDEGFEPPQTESESGVLPLHKSPMWCTQAEQRLLLYAETAECQEEISDFPRNFFFWRSLRSVSKPDIVWSKKGGFILCIMEPYSRDHS